MSKQEKYKAGIDNNLRYANQPTIKVGLRKTGGANSENETLRGVIIVDIASDIATALAATPEYIANSPYSVLHCSLTLSSANGKTGGSLSVSMLPLDTNINDSVSWNKPSQNPNDITGSWTSGGSSEPLAQEIVQRGVWSSQNVSFDITPFVNIWRGTTKSNFSLLIKSDETAINLWEFHSQQAQIPVFGGSPQTNAVFIGAGDSTTISTEGIVVKISPHTPYITVESANYRDSDAKHWSALNASVSVGNTLSMFLTDLQIPPKTYTLIDKRSGNFGVQFVLSGSTAGLESTLHTAAEFQCNGNAASGYGIVQFQSPSNTLLTDFSTLVPNETVIFDYTPTISPNNGKSYTLDYYADETQKNNRARLYLKEQTVSENRNGLLTEIKTISIRPRLSMSLTF